jgi:hypothetical protein
MKFPLTLISIFALLSVIHSQADDALPSRFNFDRYSKMVNRSPFAIATAVALPSATADFAKDLYVANAAHSSEGDLVTIASTSDQNFKKYLTTREPMDGYSIASIGWSDRVGETKVTISKDGKFATLTFNQTLLSQPPSPSEPVPNVPTANAPTSPPPLIRPTPWQPPRPHVRGTIQRSPKALSVPTPNLGPSQAEKLRELQSLQGAPAKPN